VTWAAHVTWRADPPPGLYDPGVELDHARTLAGYATREAAYEAARAFGRTLTADGARNVAVAVGNATTQPLDPDRYRAWVGHCAAVEHAAGMRLAATGGHDHRRGWDRCPICSQPGDYRTCGLDDCTICRSAQSTAAGR
jgi:hypothetical protein